MSPQPWVTSYTFYKNGNMDIRQGMPVALVSFAGVPAVWMLPCQWVS